MIYLNQTFLTIVISWSRVEESSEVSSEIVLSPKDQLDLIFRYFKHTVYQSLRGRDSEFNRLRRGDSKLYKPVMEEYVPDSSENDEVSSLSFCSYGGCLTILLLMEELELQKYF